MYGDIYIYIERDIDRERDHIHMFVIMSEYRLHMLSSVHL